MLHVWLRAGFCCLLFGTYISAVAATADVESLIDEFDRAAIAAPKYEQQIARARRIVEVGKAKKDVELKARGLIRMVFAEITSGRWGGNWEGWRSRATVATSKLDESSRAFVEIKGLNGFLKGMYFDQIEQGIDDLRSTAAAGTQLEADAFATLAYYCLARLLIIDGQDSDGLKFLRVSELFARDAGQNASELTILQNRLAHMEGYELRPNRESMERLEELCNDLDCGSIFLMDASERLASYQETLSSFSSISVSDPTEVLNELRQCLLASHRLTKHYEEQQEWEQVQVSQQMFAKCAERLNDPTSMELANLFRAGILARLGELDQATLAMERFIRHKKDVSREQDISHQCTWFAKQLQTGGELDAAIKWLALADDYRDRSSLGRSARLSARAYVDSVMSTRQLRARNRAQATALSYQRWFFFVCISLGGGGWLLRATLQSRIVRNQLQQQVEAQTAALMEAKEYAESQNKAKTEFVARINHEIRNPMTAIVACCDLIGANTLPPVEEKETRETLLESSRSLLSLLTDVIDFSQIESGAIATEELEFSPTELLDSAMALVRPCVANGVELKSHQGLGVPKLLRADATKIRQVLVNLGQNSARHTHEGFIEFICKVQAMEPNGCRIKWTVRDSGDGISSEASVGAFAATDMQGSVPLVVEN